MAFVPRRVRSMDGSELVSITLGHPLVDGYLEFVGARGAQNTWLAVALSPATSRTGFEHEVKRCLRRLAEAGEAAGLRHFADSSLARLCAEREPDLL